MCLCFMVELLNCFAPALNVRHQLLFYHLVGYLGYLEVSQHDEAGGTDPGGGEAGHVEDTIPVLLDHVSVAQQANQHH